MFGDRKKLVLTKKNLSSGCKKCDQDKKRKEQVARIIKQYKKGGLDAFVIGVGKTTEIQMIISAFKGLRPCICKNLVQIR